MPTLSASPRARLAAIERGLAVQTEANRTLVSEVRTLAAPKPDVRSPDNGPAEPSNKQRKRTEYREQQQQARERLWPLLHECFPEAFSLPARPLAIGVHREILAVAGDSVDPHELSIFMRYWVSRWSYLRAVHVGAPRVNLDGSVAGVPTLEQRNQAGRALWGERYQEIKEATAVDVKEAEWKRHDHQHCHQRPSGHYLPDQHSNRQNPCRGNSGIVGVGQCEALISCRDSRGKSF